jgi:hypothetical protein
MKLPLTLVLIGGVSLLALSWEVSSDDDEHYFRHSSSLAAPPNARYQAECASCHMAYPPALLPARSWQTIMGRLDQHFGEDASLDAATIKEITTYLTVNSADGNKARFAKRVQLSLPADDTPLRITETPFFKGEHRELPARLYRDNPKVGSLSNCAACHTRAEQGSFRERDINIPGFGRWDD